MKKILNYFNRELTTNTVDFKDKSTNEIIDEIHESFYTEVDRLLADAKILNCLDTDKDLLIEKCERLKSLGFRNTTEIKEAEAELRRLRVLSEENNVKNRMTETINYFSFKYPNYKFITEESVKMICEKYNLIYGTIDKYIGSVPDSNIKHIEDFKINEEDECFIYKETMWYPSFGEMNMRKKIISFREYNEINDEESDAYKRTSLLDSRIQVVNMKSPLEIAAPLKDFNIDEMEVKDFKLSKIEIPDPVVLKPVYFKGIKHYLIVTAWGQEASDTLVVNERNN